MGPAAQALGFAPGQVVERDPPDLLFGERKAPDGTPLGRPPIGGRKAAEVYAGLLAAEPQATAERKRELRARASREARQSPLSFDLTLSLSKSVSTFHASLGDNARLAREAGDADGERYWSGLVAEVDEMIMQATDGHWDGCTSRRVICAESTLTRRGRQRAGLAFVRPFRSRRAAWSGRFRQRPEPPCIRS